MPKCSYCGSEEVKNTPLCGTCGAIRYPVSTSIDASQSRSSKQEKLKLSAIIAATVLTPGSFIVLALVGANKLKSKIRNRK